MAFKLSKAEIKRRDEFVAQLKLLETALEAAIETFNDEVATAFGAVEQARDAYNDKIGDVGEFLGDLRDRFREDFDDKSERWRDGETGRRVEAWLDDIENLPLDRLDIDEPDRLEVPDMELGDALADLVDDPACAG